MASVACCALCVLTDTDPVAVQGCLDPLTTQAYGSWWTQGRRGGSCFCWKGDICSALGFCSTGRRIQQPSTRTRHPAMTRWVLGLCGGVGTPPVPLPLLTLEPPPARLSPESSTTARGTAVPAPPPTAARSSRRHTRRMCASFMKVGAPLPLVCFCCPLWASRPKKRRGRWVEPEEVGSLSRSSGLEASLGE